MKENKDYSQFSTIEELSEYILTKEVYSATDNGIHEIERLNHLIDLGKQCNTISELGVWQGRTLALFIIQKPKKITGIDIDLSRMNSYKDVFYNYSKDHNINLEMLEVSSTSIESVRDVELLHIDSLHTPSHLQKELNLHANHVSKFITFHDTKLGNKKKGTEFQLWKIVEKFLENNNNWELYEHYTLGKCGHATIKRV